MTLLRRHFPRRAIGIAAGLALLAVLVWVGFILRWQTKDETTHFRLANGMEVMVIPNHRVPAVVHMVWYKLGAQDEMPGKSGLAHFLEHLMFKGTEKYGPGEFSTIIAEQGGNDNAFTSHDYTAFFQAVPKEALAKAMELEADRMTNLKLSSAEVAKERDVILEERRSRSDNNPQALLDEQMNAALYLNHPYHKPVIGWKHEMEGLTRDDAMNFYRRHYAPNNAVLVVAGDVTPLEVRALAEQYYGHIDSRLLPKRIMLSEPPAIAARYLFVRDPKVTEPEWSRLYLAPSQTAGNIRHAYALSVLAQILGGSEASRLYQALVVEQGIATSVDAGYDDINLGLGTFGLHVQPKPGHSPEEIERAVEQVIQQVIQDGVTREELKRSKNVLKAEAIYARDGLYGMAMIYGRALVSGLPPEYVTDWPKQMDAVTAEAIQAAAKEVLQREHSVTGVLLPEDEILSSHPAGAATTKCKTEKEEKEKVTLSGAKEV